MIAAHLLVKDEVALLERLLLHLEKHVDQVVVTDTGSRDGSLRVAREMADVVMQQPLNMDFAQARNAGVARCECPWVLQVDADEWPQPALLAWLRAFANKAPRDVDGVAICRENLIDGEQIGPNTYEWHVRMFRRHLRYVGALHESVRAQKVVLAPGNLLLLHHKTQARQERQNAFYAQWRQP